MVSLRQRLINIENKLASIDAKFSTLKGIRWASNFATSGSGTIIDPYISGLQQAHDDLPAKGGVVYVMHTHLINQRVNATKPCFFIGPGCLWDNVSVPVTSHNVKLADSSDCDMFAFNDTATCVYMGGLIGMGLDGNKTNQASGSGVLIKNAMDISIRRSVLTNFKEHGIKLEPFGAAGGQNRVANFDCSNNWIEMMDGEGIYMLTNIAVNCSTINIANNIFTKGVYLVNNSATSIVEGNHIINNRMGGGNITIYGMHGLLIDGNTLSNGYIVVRDQSGVTRKGINITRNVFDTVSGNAFIGISGPLQGVLIAHNNLELSTYTGGPGNSPFRLDYPGAYTGTIFRIHDNIGINPIGLVSTSIDNTNFIIKPYKLGADKPTTPSQDYVIDGARVFIVSDDSGDTNCSISVKDEEGNTILSGLSTFEGWLEPGWQINWGAYTGTDPDVSTYFV